MNTLQNSPIFRVLEGAHAKERLSKLKLLIQSESTFTFKEVGSCTPLFSHNLLFFLLALSYF